MRVDVTPSERDFLRAGNHHPLPVLHSLDERGSLQKRFVRTGIQPGIASSQYFNPQLSLFHIKTVEVCYFDFSAGRRFQVGGQLHYSTIIKIDARDSVIRTSYLWLLLDAQYFTILI